MNNHKISDKYRLRKKPHVRLVSSAPYHNPVYRVENEAYLYFRTDFNEVKEVVKRINRHE